MIILLISGPLWFKRTFFLYNKKKITNIYVLKKGFLFIGSLKWKRNRKRNEERRREKLLYSALSDCVFL